MCLGMANGYRVPGKEKSDFVISDKDGKLVVNFNGLKNTSKICGAFTIIEDDVTESKIEIAKEIVLNEMFDVIKDVVKNHEEFFIIKELSEEDDPLGRIEFKKGFSVGKAAVGAVLLGPIGLVGGALGKKKVSYYCTKCNFQHDYDA